MFFESAMHAAKTRRIASLSLRAAA